MAKPIFSTVCPQRTSSREVDKLKLPFRNYVPWGVIAGCYTLCPLLMLLQRWHLARENKKRDQEPPDTTYDDVWVKVEDEKGNIIEKRVDKAFLDLTDRQNREFRYVL